MYARIDFDNFTKVIEFVTENAFTYGNDSDENKLKMVVALLITQHLQYFLKPQSSDQNIESFFTILMNAMKRNPEDPINHVPREARTLTVLTAFLPFMKQSPALYTDILRQAPEWLEKLHTNTNGRCDEVDTFTKQFPRYLSDKDIGDFLTYYKKIEAIGRLPVLEILVSFLTAPACTPERRKEITDVFVAQLSTPSRFFPDHACYALLLSEDIDFLSEMKPNINPSKELYFHPTGLPATKAQEHIEKQLELHSEKKLAEAQPPLERPIEKPVMPHDTKKQLDQLIKDLDENNTSVEIFEKNESNLKGILRIVEKYRLHRRDSKKLITKLKTVNITEDPELQLLISNIFLVLHKESVPLNPPLLRCFNFSVVRRSSLPSLIDVRLLKICSLIKIESGHGCEKDDIYHELVELLPSLSLEQLHTILATIGGQSDKIKQMRTFSGYFDICQFICKRRIEEIQPPQAKSSAAADSSQTLWSRNSTPSDNTGSKNNLEISRNSIGLQ